VRDPRDLLTLLGLDALAARISDAAAAQFPLRVPRAFVARMRHWRRRRSVAAPVLPLDDEDRSCRASASTRWATRPRAPRTACCRNTAAAPSW
jgi:L-lysine 2,3-aminomutase